MKHQAFFYSAVFLLSILAGILIFSPRRHTSQEERVILSDSGFSPEEIVIKKGTTVRFLIQGKQAHWPASNFHPTHGEYPEAGGCIGSKLDACEALKPGETYSFMFNKAGTWGMHDHLAPGATMTIKVIGNSNEDPSPTVTIDYNTSVKIVTGLIKKDPQAAWQYLKKTFFIDNGVQNVGVHEYAHQIGNALYRRYGLDGLTSCDSTFAFGCYHGVIEKMLASQGKDGVKKTEAYCMKKYLPQDTQTFSACIHGIGHGIITWNGLRLQNALEICDIVHDDNRSSCYDGIFMEYNSTVPKSHFNKDTLWKLCEDLPLAYQPKCAKYQVDIIEQRLNLKLPDMIATCQNAPNFAMQDSCVIGMSGYIGRFAKGNAQQIQTTCSLLNQNLQFTCIVSVGEDVVLQKYPHWETESEAVCSSLSSELQNQCRNIITSVKKAYAKSPQSQ